MFHHAFIRLLGDGDYWKDELVKPQRILLATHVNDKNHFVTSRAFLILNTPELPFASTSEAIISIFSLNIEASKTVVSISPPSPDGLKPNSFSRRTSSSITSLSISRPSQVWARGYAKMPEIITLKPFAKMSSKCSFWFLFQRGLKHQTSSSLHRRWILSDWYTDSIAPETTPSIRKSLIAWAMASFKSLSSSSRLPSVAFWIRGKPRASAWSTVTSMFGV